MSTWQHIGLAGEETYAEACLSVARLNERGVHRRLSGHIAVIEQSETAFVEHRCDIHTSRRLDCFVAFTSLADSHVHEQVTY
jgi:hypothetical protein